MSDFHCTVDAALATSAARLKLSRRRAFDLDAYLRRAENRARRHAATLMPNHVILLHLASTSMLLFAKYVRAPRKNNQRTTFSAIHHRATNHLLCMWGLLLGGFEESVRPITRSYLESLDLALVCLADKALSDAYFGDDADFESFWKTHIAYGRIYPHLEKAYSLAGFDQSTIRQKIAMRKEQKTLLSGAVHGDESGAFRSLVVPPLGYPEMLSLEPHGVISFHTANHVAAVINETYEYCSAVMKIMISDPDVLYSPRSKSLRQNFAMHFFAFQEELHARELQDGSEILAPDHGKSASKNG